MVFNSFKTEMANKIAERKLCYEEERERVLEALSREFINEPRIIKRIEKIIKL